MLLYVFKGDDIYVLKEYPDFHLLYDIQTEFASYFLQQSPHTSSFFHDFDVPLLGFVLKPIPSLYPDYPIFFEGYSKHFYLFCGHRVLLCQDNEIGRKLYDSFWAFLESLNIVDNVINLPQSPWGRINHDMSPIFGLVLQLTTFPDTPSTYHPLKLQNYRWNSYI